MYFALQTPSLHYLALVKVAVALFNQRDIFTQIVQTFNGRLLAVSRVNLEKWKEIEELVQSKVSALPLPEAWKNKLINLTKPLGKEIICWCQYHNYTFNYMPIETLFPQLCQQLRWTMRGTIDYAKTAELMVKDERVDVERRYIVACLNCLEDEARELIRLIPNDRRQQFIDNMIFIDWTDHHFFIIGYFTCTLNVNADQWNQYFQTMFSPADYNSESSIQKWLFKKMVPKCNRATCEFLFKKLSQEENAQVLKEFQIRRFHRSDAPTCGVIYCWSLMNEEQQERTIQARVYDVLRCLLEWPMQFNFMEAARCRWGYLDSDACGMLLDAIVVKIGFGCKDYDYSQLFWECWRMSPDEYKQHYLWDLVYVVGLIQTKEAEFIKLLFHKAFLPQITTLFNQYDEIRQVLLDKEIISDAILLEFKETAALNSLNNPQDVGKRFRSQHVSRFVDIVMERRLSERRLVLLATS